MRSTAARNATAGWPGRGPNARYSRSRSRARALVVASVHQLPDRLAPLVERHVEHRAGLRCVSVPRRAARHLRREQPREARLARLRGADHQRRPAGRQQPVHQPIEAFVLLAQQIAGGDRRPRRGRGAGCLDLAQGAGHPVHQHPDRLGAAGRTCEAEQGREGGISPVAVRAGESGSDAVSLRYRGPVPGSRARAEARWPMKRWPKP